MNNDGLVDLFVAKGNVAEMPDFADEGSQQPAAAAAPTASSSEAGDKAGIANIGNSRGAALADFNLDGLLDLVVVNRWISGAGLAQHQRRRRQLDRAASSSSRRRTATPSAPGSR